MNKFILIIGFLIIGILVACEQNHSPNHNITSTQQESPKAVSKPPNIFIDRTINQLPLGDRRLTGPLPDEWSLEAEDDLLSELITANQKITLISTKPKSVSKLDVNNEFIPSYATGLHAAYQEFATKNQKYTLLQPIWSTENLHIVMASTEDLKHNGIDIAQRTDLLVLNEDKIIDGITLYYSLNESTWGAYQLFFIDKNKQIQLQRFVMDEQSIQTMESLSLVVLPNGKISKI